MKNIVLSLLLLTSTTFGAEYLVRFQSSDAAILNAFTVKHGGKLDLVSAEGVLYKWTANQRLDASSIADESVVYIQPNSRLGLIPNPSIEKNRVGVLAHLRSHSFPSFDAPQDNPEVQNPSMQAAGSDPMLDKSWGLASLDAKSVWANTKQGKDIIVAVTDTGVDYNHVDLINNMWRNKKEIAGNGVDDDKNGYVDDIVGYDFSGNDNKPYDLTLDLMQILTQGGNPGHGTHVAGVIGSVLNNSNGIAGLAPQVKIMAVRFISEKGQGTDEAAIKSIDYAVANGAHIINASWGGEKGSESDQALQDAIQRAEDKGVLFVAAAGNGRLSGMSQLGFNNDTDAKPMIPASFTHDNIVSVAALDVNDKMGVFSNYGPKSVDIGAPGVKVLSTVPGSKYQDTILELGSLKVTWDGTSMAAPHVAAALAVIWSQHPSDTPEKVKKTLLDNAASTASLQGKVLTQGKLSLKNIR